MSVLRITLTLLALVVMAVAAELPRTPVGATPRIGGREISRFVVLEPIYLAIPTVERSFQFQTMLSVIPPGQFIPLSEDRDGVFYQSANGLGQPESITGKPLFVPGGLYVKKQQERTIYAYFGDARGERTMKKAPPPLSLETQKKLLVGRSERKRP